MLLCNNALIMKIRRGTHQRLLVYLHTSVTPLAPTEINEFKDWNCEVGLLSPLVVLFCISCFKNVRQFRKKEKRENNKSTWSRLMLELNSIPRVCPEPPFSIAIGFPSVQSTSLLIWSKVSYRPCRISSKVSSLQLFLIWFNQNQSAYCKIEKVMFKKCKISYPGVLHPNADSLWCWHTTTQKNFVSQIWTQTHSNPSNM